MVFDILGYITKCPYLKSYITNVDFLGKNPYSLTVGGVPENKTVKEYTDGDQLMESTFSLRLRLPYGIESQNNINNSKLIKNVADWFLKNNERGILPELSADKIPISVTCNFLQDKTTYLADTVIYTADITVLYYKTKGL